MSFDKNFIKTYLLRIESSSTMKCLIAQIPLTQFGEKRQLLNKSRWWVLTALQVRYKLFALFVTRYFRNHASVVNTSILLLLFGGVILQVKRWIFFMRLFMFVRRLIMMLFRHIMTLIRFLFIRWFHMFIKPGSIIQFRCFGFILCINVYNAFIVGKSGIKTETR